MENKKLEKAYNDSYYEIKIINGSDVVVATYNKWAENCNEAVEMVLNTIILLDGDKIEVNEIEANK